MKHYPMTEDQRLSLDANIATIMRALNETTNLLRACYDDQDPQLWRAEEVRAAMQRLIWALNRDASTQAVESGAAEAAGDRWEATT